MASVAYKTNKPFELSDFQFDNIKFDKETHVVFATAYLISSKNPDEIFSLDKRNGEHVSEFSVVWNRCSDYVDVQAIILDSDLCEMTLGVEFTDDEKEHLKKILSDLIFEKYGEPIDVCDPNPKADGDFKTCEMAHSGMCSECPRYLYDPDGCPYA